MLKKNRWRQVFHFHYRKEFEKSETKDLPEYEEHRLMNSNERENSIVQFFTDRVSPFERDKID